MRVAVRAALSAAIAVVLIVGTSVPVLSGSRPTPVVTAKILSVTCNPAGVPGLRVTASGTATGGTLRGADMYVGEFQAVSDPAYAPFPWTGATLANWTNRDGWRQGVAADTRTLDTTDPYTFNQWNHAVDLWSRSDASSWWIVIYDAWASSSRASAEWYVSCPGGTHVDGTALREITFTDEAGLR